jgi:hypothetical protein
MPVLPAPLRYALYRSVQPSPIYPLYHSVAHPPDPIPPHFAPEAPAFNITLYCYTYNFGDDHHCNGDDAADDEKTRHALPHDVKGREYILQNIFTHTRPLLL